MREAETTRKTRETQISVWINLDGTGKVETDTSVAFFDHLMRTLGVHSKIDLKIEAKGDLKHHIIEDVGICLGEAVRKALGDSTSINRFGYAIVPMDDALAISAVDLVTRPYAKIELAMNNDYVDNVSGQELLHFLETFVMSLKATVHLQVQYGNNDHHKIEAAMKALSLSLKQAISQTPNKKYLPSAKGSV